MDQAVFLHLNPFQQCEVLGKVDYILVLYTKVSNLTLVNDNIATLLKIYVCIGPESVKEKISDIITEHESLLPH